MPKGSNGVNKGGASRSQNFIYIRDMLGELRKVAENESADMLCYLIEMTYIETGDIISKSHPASSGIENKRNKPSGMSL